MITVNISDFRKNIKKYLDLAQREKIIIHRSKGKSIALVPTEFVDKKTPYSKDFIEKISLAMEESESGEYKTVNPENIWESILSE